MAGPGITRKINKRCDRLLLQIIQIIFVSQQLWNAEEIS